MSYLKIDRVCKSFSNGTKTTEVLQDIRLNIDKGEFENGNAKVVHGSGVIISLRAM